MVLHPNSGVQQNPCTIVGMVLQPNSGWQYNPHNPFFNSENGTQTQWWGGSMILHPFSMVSMKRQSCGGPKTKNLSKILDEIFPIYFSRFSVRPRYLCFRRDFSNLFFKVVSGCSPVKGSLLDNFSGPRWFQFQFGSMLRLSIWRALKKGSAARNFWSMLLNSGEHAVEKFGDTNF